MYASIGRIGMIIPADNAVMEPDFHRMVPQGVSTHVARLHKCPRPEMPKAALPLAATLVHTRVNMVGYMCAASSFALGIEGNEALCRDLTEASGGLPSFTATTVMVEALRAVRARRVSVLSPHPPEIAQLLTRYLEQSGFVVTSMQALGLPIADINDSTPEQIHAEIRKMDIAGADSIFVAATNFRAIDVVDKVESETGLPVVTSNQAAIWKGLALLGFHGGRPGFGRLLQA